MIPSAEIDEIVRRVAEAVAWCELRANPGDPRDSLRSARLKPPPTESEYDSLGGTYEAVDYVCERRRTALGSAPTEASIDLRGGWLLALEVDCQLAEGACEAASQGFFDGNDTPPWDTWIALVKDDTLPKGSGDRYLLSWVPPTFVDQAQAGSLVSSTDCLWWFGRGDHELEIALRERGLKIEEN
jgi:hypothetical protein